MAAKTVDTRRVQGRRTLHFTSLDEVLADAERLVSAESVQTLGNWPLGQLLSHLALAIDRSIDGIALRAPWYIRLFGPLLKGRFLRQGVMPGFQLPSDRVDAAFPAVSSPREALEALRRAIGRSKAETMRARHPVFGWLTHEEWAQFHLRHAEMHLSFAVPGPAITDANRKS